MTAQEPAMATVNQMMPRSELAQYFGQRFFLIKPTCSVPFPVYPGGMEISSSNRTGREIYEIRPTSHCGKAIGNFFPRTRLPNDY
jgi:hypothetical protein